jgi:signal transduction histidine kinase
MTEETWEEIGSRVDTTAGGARRRWQRALPRLEREVLKRVRRLPPDLRRRVLRRLGVEED